MAGSDSRFSATDFREAIRFAMQMAKPKEPERQATFKWRSEHTYSNADPSGRPYSYTATPTTTTSHADVQVPVAIEYAALNDNGTALGRFDESKVIITVLDEDYALVEGADLVEIDGTDFIIRRVAPPVALFEVTVYQVYAEAQDEA